MSNSIEDVENEIIKEFESFDDEMDRYEYIIDEGKKLEPMPDQFKKDENIVKGCQSTVWLYCYAEQDKVFYYADSNTDITKGMISLLLRVLNGRTAQEILDCPLDFIAKTNLRSQLSSQRSNGLSAMILKLRNGAKAHL